MVDQRTFEHWRDGNRQAFLKACEELWNVHRPKVHRLLMRLSDRDRAAEGADHSFWMTMEEIDLGVSGGVFMTDPVPQTGNAAPDFLGKVSKRNYRTRAQIVWRSEAEFNSFVRTCYINRALEWRRKEILHLPAPLPEEVETGDVMTHPGAMFDYLAMESRFVIECIVENLARLAAQYEGRERAAPEGGGQGVLASQVLRHTITYIKWRLAECSNRWKTATVEEIEGASVKALLADAELEKCVFDDKEWRNFLRRRLFHDPEDQGNRDALYQRVHRLKERLRTLFNTCR